MFYERRKGTVECGCWWSSCCWCASIIIWCILCSHQLLMVPKNGARARVHGDESTQKACLPPGSHWCGFVVLGGQSFRSPFRNGISWETPPIPDPTINLLVCHQIVPLYCQRLVSYKSTKIIEVLFGLYICCAWEEWCHPELFLRCNIPFLS